MSLALHANTKISKNKSLAKKKLSKPISRNRNLLSHTEKEVGQIIRDRIKHKGIRFEEIADQLRPKVSVSTISNMLKGKSPLDLGRLVQIARILKEDPTEILSSALVRTPVQDYAFTIEQEKFICGDPIRYKLTEALIGIETTPKTLDELKELFPEYQNSMSSALDGLIKKQIIKQDSSGRYKAATDKIAKFHFTDEYHNLLKDLSLELHQTAVEIMHNHQHLDKYILTKFHLGYLTPEQMIFIKKQLLETQKQVWNFHHQNIQDPNYRKLSANNLMACMTYFAPLSSVSFKKNNKD